jgi:arylsulfatase A-like enzyme
MARVKTATREVHLPPQDTATARRNMSRFFSEPTEPSQAGSRLAFTPSTAFGPRFGGGLVLAWLALWCLGGPLPVGERNRAAVQAAGVEPAQAPLLAGSRPNIVFVLTDDQGYGDLSAHGNPVLKTPHLDALFAQSLRFTDFLVSPTCSPTRAALMTGRHEFRNGVTHTIFERERLTLDATTVAEVLRSAGYATGIFGKWHLGDEPEYQPDRRGFDEVCIHGGGGIGQTYPGSCGDAPGNRYFDPTLLHNGTFEKTTGYCTDLFFHRATRWIELQAAAGRPFFATIATNAPHSPYLARPEDRAVYEGLPDLDVHQRNFFGMIHNIDENVGRLLARLDELGISRDTLVVFMNDNGGTAGVPIFNGGMRGAKGTAWLGGTRAMSLWHWPGRILPGDCDRLVGHIDLFPTFAELAGVDLAADARVCDQVEGQSLVPLLADPRDPAGQAWDERPLFTHVGRWPRGSEPDQAKYSNAAVRTKDWALVSPDGGPVPHWQLFDLRADFAQEHDVLAEHPDVARDLAATFDRWWGEVRGSFVNEAAMGPRINPFQEGYYRQFGGEPTAEDIELMRPDRTVPLPRQRSIPRKAKPAS